mgnify:CR=1 FL=1
MLLLLVVVPRLEKSRTSLLILTKSIAAQQAVIHFVQLVSFQNGLKIEIKKETVLSTVSFYENRYIKISYFVNDLLRKKLSFSMNIR